MSNGNGFRFYDGLAAETSGGLLIALPSQNAERFIRELEQLDDAPAWIIGSVRELPFDIKEEDNDPFPYTHLSTPVKIIDVLSSLE